MSQKSRDTWKDNPHRQIDLTKRPYAFLVALLYPELWLKFLTACKKEKNREDKMDKDLHNVRQSRSS
jgi:hypothetical protein